MTVEEQMLMNTLTKECERLHKEVPRWIPASEPPKEDGDYLVTYLESKRHVIDIGRYCNDLYSFDKGYFPNYHESGWCIYYDHEGYIRETVIAWMPLPEPYQKGEEE